MPELKLNWFPKKNQIPLPEPGLYHYSLRDANDQCRIHLRLDSDRNGLIIVNANQVGHLNPTAAYMTWLYLEGYDTDHAVNSITKEYKVNRKQAVNDYAKVIDQLHGIINPNGACPIHDLNLDIIPPFSTQPDAPYRMDLALTYRCNNDCSHCYNDRNRNHPQLHTDQWKAILDRLWDIGIPHIVFTGGEPTLRDDLPQLIYHAEQLGQITGINTNGRRLQDAGYLHSLITSGLDHLQITVESHDPVIHDKMVNNKGAWKQTIEGLKNALKSNLYVMTNTTLLSDNQDYLEETLLFLASLGVPTIGLNALIYSGHGIGVGTGLKEDQLPSLLALARQITEANQQKLIWYTPTQYCHFDPMQLHLGVKSCTAARYNMCIESDGSVLPCQSYYHSLGNILFDTWDSIWNHELSLWLRNREYAPTKCNGCALIQECGGGCPLQNEYQKISLRSAI